mmetsp:Transcript_40425/g.67728  ORF Transcript_40425/g.67728 Transcript_40425/m.67728 type:complete len:85 (-) Transcript_40425:16-270(-)
MQQLVDVKTSTDQANLEMQQQLEKQEQLYQQQQQQYQQPQQQMMPPQGHQDWGVQAAHSNNSSSRSINAPNPYHKVEGREFDYF